MSRRIWTAEEDELLRTHWATSTWRKLGERLSRSRSSIFHRAAKLSLRKVVLRRWSEAEDEVIRHNNLRSLREVAQLLGRRESEVSSRANKLRLPFRRRRGYAPHQYGYTWVPARNAQGIVQRRVRHRVVMETVLGRPLLRREHVHHINLNKQDDEPTNLLLVPSASAHRSIHASLDALLPKLVRRNIVAFDYERGSYYLCETDK